MSAPNVRKMYSVFLGLAALSIGIYLAAKASVLHAGISQEQEKIFEKKPRARVPEIVQLAEIKARGASRDSEDEVKPKEVIKAVKMGESFEGEEHWLKGSSFRLKNHSNKEIVFIDLDLSFPETTSSGNEMAFPLKLGRRPGMPEYDSKEPLSVKPGEEVILTVDEDTYARLTRFIEKRQPISSINKVRVGIGFVIFADLTGWDGGSYYRQDPSDPRRFKNIGYEPPDN